MALPLYIPFAYITFLFGLLWLFSRYYRSRSLRMSIFHVLMRILFLYTP